MQTKKSITLDKDEHELLVAFVKDEWKSTDALDQEIVRAKNAAANTLRKGIDEREA